MRKQSHDFLEALMNSPTPSSFEAPGQRVWCDYVRPFADKLHTDSYGNALAVLNPKGSPVVMVDGHVDEIGLMIKHIDETGYLFFQSIGMVSPTILAAQRVVIHAAKGPVHGVIGIIPPHMAQPKTDEDKGKEPAIHEFYIDIGAADAKDARRRVSIGDPATLVGEFRHLTDDVVVGRAFDDRAGTFVAAETLRLAAAKRKQLDCCIVACSTVQEEYGIRGAMMNAANVMPDLAMAIEVALATDVPGIDENQWGQVHVGKGPHVVFGRENHPVLVDRIRAVAKARKLPLQEGAIWLTTNALSINDITGGAPVAVVSTPVRNMHSPVEVLSLRDLEQTADLVAAVCLDIKKDETFRVEV